MKINILPGRDDASDNANANQQVADITGVSILLGNVEVLDLGATPVSSANGVDTFAFDVKLA